jgi:hypothetical protein
VHVADICRRSQSSAAVLDFIGRILLGLGETGGAAALTFGEIPLGLSAPCSHSSGAAHIA